MISTGIVRRIDDLGRIVIPKELRYRLNIEQGQPFELFLDGKNIVLQKYCFSDNPVNAIRATMDIIANDDNLSEEKKEAALNKLKESIKALTELN